MVGNCCDGNAAPLFLGQWMILRDYIRVYTNIARALRMIDEKLSVAMTYPSVM